MNKQGEKEFLLFELRRRSQERKEKGDRKDTFTLLSSRPKKSWERGILEGEKLSIFPPSMKGMGKRKLEKGGETAPSVVANKHRRRESKKAKGGGLRAALSVGETRQNWGFP